jgi:hypothetical protein
MSTRMNNTFSMLLRAGTAVTLGGLLATAAQARTSNSVIVVPPAGLPALARQSGDGLLLHTTIDGREILYVEQNQGQQLAVLDVTDPRHVTSQGTQPLAAGGPFEFVRALSETQELVRYRQSEQLAVLDLRRELHPTLAAVAAADTATASAPYASAEGLKVQDLRFVNGADPASVIKVSAVSAQQVSADTGTTFLLAKDGVYEVRRPSVEADHAARLLEALE